MSNLYGDFMASLCKNRPSRFIPLTSNITNKKHLVDTSTRSYDEFYCQGCRKQISHKHKQVKVFNLSVYCQDCYDIKKIEKQAKQGDGLAIRKYNALKFTSCVG